ncbi:MAG: amidase family protein [Cyanophyceae cyanobacterium]
MPSLPKFKQTVVYLTAQAAAITVLPAAEAAVFRLEEATVADINQAFEAEALTSEQLVQLYLNRIEAYDQQGPAINSLININSNALARARELDRERPADPASPLYGIPIILKDNFDTADLPTTGGSDVLAGSLPPDDAFTVEQFRDAGAVILGKANMSELALSSGRLGYSSRGGLTLNPYNLQRDASGSSSGTAAAIAANFAVLGTGTDTAGSIRGPSSFTGLVGIKPTLGLTSRDGIIPLALSVDVGGPMARTVTDAAIALGVMAEDDPSDPATLEEGQFEDYTQFLDESALAGARVGISRDFLGGNPEVDRIVEEVLATVEELGATVVDADFPQSVIEAASYGTLLDPIVQSEFLPQIESYLQTLDDEYPQTLEGLIEASLAPEIANSETPVNPNRIAVYQDSLETGGLSNPEYLEAIAQLPELRADILSVFAANSLDAIVYPTVACPPSPITAADGSTIDDPTYFCDLDNIEGDPYRAGYLANLTGFPDITVPAGFTDQGLPIGLSFFGTAYSEPTLLGLGYSFEQATQVRRPPATTPPLPGEEFEFDPVAETVPEPGTIPALTLIGLGALSVKLTRRDRVSSKMNE